MTTKTLTIEHPGGHGLNDRQTDQALADFAEAEGIPEGWVAKRSVTESGSHTKITVEWGEGTPPADEPVVPTLAASGKVEGIKPPAKEEAPAKAPKGDAKPPVA